MLTLQAQGINEPITALQLVNTATPIGFGLAFFIAKLLRKNIYNREEVETLKSAVPMGIVNIVEGSIPIVMNDIVRGIAAAARAAGRSPWSMVRMRRFLLVEY